MGVAISLIYYSETLEKVSVIVSVSTSPKILVLKSFGLNKYRIPSINIKKQRAYSTITKLSSSWQLALKTELAMCCVLVLKLLVSWALISLWSEGGQC